MRRLPLRSPPRVWGKAKNRCRSCPLTRITPACAGKRAASLAEITSLWDHPRVCGEKRCGENLLNIAPGSPPRMRGKVAECLFIGARCGITPAYAGKRATPSDFRRPRRGSPPRMRGKGGIPGSCRTRKGITPAYAGKSWMCRYRTRWKWDHPRVCGEKQKLLKLKADGLGSPPRMRGKDGLLATQSLVLRITPAYAGKSDATRWTITIRRDHPRVCGEKTLCRSTVVPVWGSPPRVRGKAVPLRSAAASGCRGPSVPEYDAPP